MESKAGITVIQTANHKTPREIGVFLLPHQR
nr:MAG TPA: hypothetical protein [Caudoviricetes sp.]